MSHVKAFLAPLSLLFALSLAITCPAQAGEREPAGTPAASVTKAATSQAAPAKAQAQRKRSPREIWLERARNNPQIMTGMASWYGRDFDRRPTASGLPYDMYTFTAAHRTLPIGTVVRVTDQYNGKSVMVCVTDRGPYVKGRIIDMSYAAAGRIGLKEKGVSRVGLEVVSDAKGRPLDAGDAFYIQLGGESGKDRIGPYAVFADAAAMQEAMLRAHPDAQVVLDKNR